MRISNKIVRIAALMLILMLIYQLILPVNAADLNGDVFVIENNVYSGFSQNQRGNGWNWDASSFTLTLDGYNSGAIMFVPASQTSRTFNVVVKNNNTVSYDSNQKPCPVDACSMNGMKCVFCQRNSMVAALCIKNANVLISGGGTLNTTLSGSAGNYSFFATYGTTIENTILNCVGRGIALACDSLVVKNSTLSFDSPHAYQTRTSSFENSTLNYKNSNPNDNYSEMVTSGGKHTFNKCTVDILIGARPLNSSPIRSTCFAGLASYEFDNTVVRVKQGQHNNTANSITIFSLGYPENEGNKLTIRNNSRLEFERCVSKAFAVFEMNVSDSVITGTCTGNPFSAIKLNISDSNVDVTCSGNPQNDQAYFTVHTINISNSNIKGKTNSNIWAPYDISYPSIEKKLLLADTYLDIEGKVDKFGDKWNLNYTTPEKWKVILDGTESGLSVNSPQLNLRHGKIVIKVDENYNASKPNNTTSDATNSSKPISATTDSSNSSNTTGSDSIQGTSEETVNEQLDQTTTDSTVTTGSEESKNTIKTDKVQKGETNKISPIILVVILSVLVIGGAGVAFYFFKKRLHKDTPLPDEIEAIKKADKEITNDKLTSHEDINWN